MSRKNRSEFPEFHLLKKQEIPGNMAQENVQKTFNKCSKILVGISSQDSRMARVPLEILFAGYLPKARTEDERCNNFYVQIIWMSQ